MTIKQAAEYLGLHPDTVRQQIGHGSLKAEKLGPIWVIRISELRRYKAENRGKPGPKPGKRHKG